jgi:hypothetical protein
MYSRKFLRLRVKAEGAQGDERSRVTRFCSDVQLFLSGEAVDYECVYAVWQYALGGQSPSVPESWLSKAH